MIIVEAGIARDMTAAELAEFETTRPVLQVLDRPIIVSPADLWRRADRPGEAQKILDAMEAQPIRIRKIFDRADTYQSDDELWPLLVEAATTLFGAERAAELLAPSA